jgi:hypothetical protein
MPDAFLCSHPKSGRTWVRFSLANYLRITRGLKIEIDFNSAYSVIPAVHTGIADIETEHFAYPDREDVPLVAASHWPYPDASTPRPRRLGAERSVVRIQSPRLAGEHWPVHYCFAWESSSEASPTGSRRCPVPGEGALCPCASGEQGLKDACVTSGRLPARYWRLSGRAGGDHAGLVGEDHCLHSVAKAELREHVCNMGLDGPLADYEAGGDLGVRETASKQFEHLALPCCQFVELGRRMCR